MDLVIDGRKIKSKKELIIELKAQIKSTAFYNDNFDALFDVLSNYQGIITIKVFEENMLIKNLGNDYIVFKKLVTDLKKEGKNIGFK